MAEERLKHTQKRAEWNAEWTANLQTEQDAQMEKEKLDKYAETRTLLVPAILESGGRFGLKFLHLIRSTFRTSESASEAYHQISCCLQMENAESIERCCRLLRKQKPAEGA